MVSASLTSPGVSLETWTETVPSELTVAGVLGQHHHGRPLGRVSYLCGQGDIVAVGIDQLDHLGREITDAGVKLGFHRIDHGRAVGKAHRRDVAHLGGRALALVFFPCRGLLHAVLSSRERQVAIEIL